MSIQFDPNAPAFGEGAEKVVDGVVAPIAPQPKEEPKAEPEVKVEEPVKPSDEENQVPYSRFKKFHDEALQARKDAEELRVRLEALESKPVPEKSNDLPDWWKNLYGDSDDSRKGWTVQQEQNERLKEDLRREALEAIRSEQREETKRQTDNLETLDDHLESISAVAGRDLTEQEQSELLDIVDDFTPKDNDGNYIGAMLSPEKAWEIHEMKQEVSKSSRKQSRDAVATLTSPHTEGQPDGDKAEKDKSWNPLDWSFLSKVK